MTRPRIAALLACITITPTLRAQITSLDLGTYRHAATFNLPAVAAAEASAVAFNRDTGTLVVLGDEGDALLEITVAGVVLGAMALVGFDDTEGLTYIGAGRFVLVEERLQDVYVLTYVAGATVSRTSLQSASLGPTIGNEGIEGISFDPRDGSFVFVKEKSPIAVRRATITFATGAASVTDLFVPSLGVTDIADVQTLAAVPSLAGTPDEDNLLLCSQESARLLEVSRAGVVLSAFDLAPLASTAEGVAIDDMGTIYVCDETPRLHVLVPPSPCQPDLTAGAVPGQPGYGTPNGVLNNDDFFYYLAIFAAGC